MHSIAMIVNANHACLYMDAEVIDNCVMQTNILYNEYFRPFPTINLTQVSNSTMYL